VNFAAQGEQGARRDCLPQRDKGSRPCDRHCPLLVRADYAAYVPVLTPPLCASSWSRALCPAFLQALQVVDRRYRCCYGICLRTDRLCRRRGRVPGKRLADAKTAG
jgi:hypothetical protein